VAQITDQGTPSRLRDEFRSARLFPGLTVGVLMAITEVIYALSLGSLIFSGELAPYLSYGIGIALATATIMLIGISLGSSVPGVTGIAQDSSSLVLGVIAAALISALPAAAMEEKLTTVLVAIGVTALLTGVFFLALGFFGLGGLVRYIPYPVMGGFLAATGWLLARGSFGVMASFPLTFANIPALLQPDQMILWIPGVLFAFVLFFGLRWIKHTLAMPGILVGFIIAFYLALLLAGKSIAEAIDQGLLLGALSGKATWHPLAPAALLAANWTAILEQGGNIAIVLVLSVVGLLLNASGIELAARRDIDLNRELRVAGLANVLSGLGGGMVGYHALDLSTLCCRIEVRGRLPGLVAGGLCAVMLFAGSALLAFFPKPVLGGLLLFLGLGFLVEWVVEGWSKLSRVDYAVVLLILVVTAATDFLIGVGVGLIVMAILFILKYSRIDVVHHVLSGAEMTSNVERFAYHRRVLAELGQQIFIIELRGFIFFGTANALLERIRRRVADREQLPARYIVLDFRRVTGLDSSAAFSFVKGRQLAEAQGITLVLTHISEGIENQFELGGLLGDGGGVRLFSDLDHGVEWCEDQLLEMEQIDKIRVPITLHEQLADSGLEPANATRLIEFLEQIEVGAGEYLIRQGEETDGLYFIEQGAVSVYLELESGQRARLQTLGPGTIVGELGFYLDTTRTASVVADSPAIAYRLTRTALSEMKAREPELAAGFHEFAVRLLSERLAATDRALEAVLR
jgi:SulP family sulfate permease